MLDELKALEIDQTRQWVLARGASDKNPVVLFVHGGPGYPLMWFSRAFDGPLLGELVVVHWDQRNAGKSYSPQTPTATFTLPRIAEDGLEVTEHLARRFPGQPLLLVGHSWGTLVASRMAALRPDAYAAYVTVGTAADGARAYAQCYASLLRLARDRSDERRLSALHELGPPPYGSFDEISRFGDLVVELVGFSGASRRYTEAELAEAVSQNGVYSEAELEAAFEALKVSSDLLTDFASSYILSEAVPRLELPVYFVQGRHDLNCPANLAREYYELLDAPRGKHWISFEDSGHLAMYDQPERFLSVLKSALRSEP